MERFSPFRLMLVELTNYIGDSERNKIMFTLEWRPGERESVRDTISLFEQMGQRGLLSEDNVDQLIYCLQKWQLTDAVEVVQKYQSTIEQRGDAPDNSAQQGLRGNPENSAQQVPRDAPDNSAQQGLRGNPENSAQQVPRDGQRKKIFISFSSKSMEKVIHIKNKLEEREEIRNECWIYPENILPGDHIYDEITNALRDAAVVLLMFDQNFLDSVECKREVSVANSENKRLIYVALQNMGENLQTTSGDPSGVQMTYSGTRRCNLYSDDKAEWDRQFNDLVKSILRTIRGQGMQS